MNIQHHTYRPIAVCSLFTAHHSQAANYAFASKEKDVETGLSYFGARYYYSDLSIWLSVDPMVDKYPSFSPYVYCADNPVKLVDPNGEEIGNYYDITGCFIGSDGKEDGKIYLVSNRESVSTNEDGNIIINNPGDVHQLPNKEARLLILNQLQNNDSKDPNSESGGCYGSFWNKEKQQYEAPCVKWGETKHYSSPCETVEMKYTQVNVPFFIVSFDFHSHGSGECRVGPFTKSWSQVPSLVDRTNVNERTGGRTFAAFGMGAQEVYFYNENGTYATWSFEQFRNNK